MSTGGQNHVTAIMQVWSRDPSNWTDCTANTTRRTGRPLAQLPFGGFVLNGRRTDSTAGSTASRALAKATASAREFSNSEQALKSKPLEAHGAFVGRF